jgi:hypothetical protein
MNDKRQRLLDALALLESLKPYVDISEALREPFVRAWSMAMKEAARAAEDYAREMP